MYQQHVSQLPDDSVASCRIIKDLNEAEKFEADTGKLIGTIDNQPYYNINLDLYQDKSTGALFRYANVEYQNSGAAILVVFKSDKEDLYLLERHFRIFTNQYHYEVPRGFANPDDIDSRISAIRELKEETGLSLDEQQRELIPLGTVFPDTGLSNAEVSLFAVELNLSGGSHIKNHDKTEDIHGYILVNSEELQKMISGNKLSDSFSLSAILKYQYIKKNNSVM